MEDQDHNKVASYKVPHAEWMDLTQVSAKWQHLVLAMFNLSNPLPNGCMIHNGMVPFQKKKLDGSL